MGLLCIHHRECICLSLVRLLLRDRILRLGAHSTESKEETKVLPGAKESPNYVSAGLLFTSQAVLNQAEEH